MNTSSFAQNLIMLTALHFASRKVSKSGSEVNLQTNQRLDLNKPIGSLYFVFAPIKMLEELTNQNELGDNYTISTNQH